MKNMQLVIDTRPNAEFKKGHEKGAINLQNGGQFETWLGSIVSPNERFYLIADTEEELEKVIVKAAKIGYERNLAAGISRPEYPELPARNFNLPRFSTNPQKYTIRRCA